jgi:hypothetical protein
MARGRPRTRQEGDTCEECGINPVRSKGYTAIGTQRFDKRCSTCAKGVTNKPWLLSREDECNICSYHPFFSGSLDVHHRDGDKTNNEPSNLMTLCASCHRELHGFEREVGSFSKAEKMLRKFIKALLN